VAAIEDEDDRPGRNEFGEPSGRTVGVSELEIWDAHRHRVALEQARLGQSDGALELEQRALQRQSASVPGQLAV
jgi:hypothetical protein